MPLDIKTYIMNQSMPVKAPYLSPMQSGPSNIRVTDSRKLDAITQKSILNNKKLSYNVDLDTAKQIAQHAKANGIDPYTALAISYQETGIKKGAPFNLNPDVYGKAFGDPQLGVKSIKDQFAYAKEMQRKGVIPQGEDFQIQGYNGYGKIKKGHIDLEGAGSIYGREIPNEGIDLKKEPLYGRRVLDIRENILKKNPELVKLIQSL